MEQKEVEKPKKNKNGGVKHYGNKGKKLDSSSELVETWKRELHMKIDHN